MKITIQSGIDARPLQQAIYQTIATGMECDAHAARQRHADRLKLLAKQCERYVPAPAPGDLFGGEE